MKFITEYNKFPQDVTPSKVGRYQIVEFNQSFTIPNLHCGDDREISVKLQKGQRVKMFFDPNIEEGYLSIIGIRPMKPRKKNESKNTDLDILWEANFVLNNPINLRVDKIPFSIKNYI